MDTEFTERPVQESYTRQEVIEILLDLSKKIEDQSEEAIKAGAEHANDWTFMGVGVTLALGELAGRNIASAIFDEQHEKVMAEALKEQETIQEAKKEVQH